MTTRTISSGTTIGSSVVAGDALDVTAAAVTIGTLVQSGGMEVVFGGGLTSQTIVSAGGFEVVSSGGVARGAILDGGTEIVSSGGEVAQAVLQIGIFKLPLGPVTSFSAAGGTIELCRRPTPRQPRPGALAWLERRAETAQLEAEEALADA